MPTKKPCPVGERFGAIVVVAEYAKKGTRFWTCRCDCGKVREIRRQQIRSGQSKSCGCKIHIKRKEKVAKELKQKTPTKQRDPRLYAVWAGMIQRCTNPKRHNYQDYGGRGISVCARWLIYYDFAADMGYRPPGTSLDRKDVNGDYCPHNCRWASQMEQNRNSRKNNNVTYRGETKCVSAWAETNNVDRSVLSWRIRHGWGVDAAINTPTQRKKA